MYAMSRPDIVTLVIHHPLRPFSCLQRCLQSLETATSLPHRVELYVQGPEGCIPLDKRLCGDPSVTYLGTHLGPVLPRIKSVASAMENDSSWWAKLDDDAAVPEGCWDLLIKALESDEDAAYAIANPNGMLAPRNMEIIGNAAVISDVTDAETVDMGDELKFHRCGFVGDGATLFRREFFEEAEYRPEFVRGADVDLAMQAKALDWHVLLCDPPRSMHYHRECTTGEYEQLRYDADQVWEAARAFRRRWNMDCPHLSQFAPRGGWGK